MSPAGGLLFAGLLVLALRQIHDPDIWFYLVVGREILATGAVPRQEFYLFPALGEPAMFSAWGFAVLHQLAHRLLGFPGMALFNAALAAGALTLMLRAALPRRAGWTDLPAGLLVLAAAFVCMEFRLSYRPEATLFLFLALEVLLLERWLEDGRMGRLLVLPLLAWLISQLHVTALLLVLVFGAYGCHWLAARLAARDTLRPLPRLVGIGLAMVALPFLNPYGADQVLALFYSLGAATESNVEYLPIWQTPYRWHFALLALAAVAAWLLTPGRGLVDALLLAGFGWLAWRYVRNLGLFALVAILPLARSAVYGWDRLAQALAPRARASLAGAMALAAAAILVAVAAPRWGTGVRPGEFPERSVEVIRRLGAGGNVMNFFHQGGYLAWALGPSWRPAVDGHFVRESFAASYHDRVMRADPDWQDLLRRYQVAIVVTPTTLPYSGQPIPLVERLADDPGWVLLASEPAGVLIARTELAQGWTPLPKAEVWRQMKREADRLAETYPGHAEAARVGALAQQRLRAAAP